MANLNLTAKQRENENKCAEICIIFLIIFFYLSYQVCSPIFKLGLKDIGSLAFWVTVTLLLVTVLFRSVKRYTGFPSDSIGRTLRDLKIVSGFIILIALASCGTVSYFGANPWIFYYSMTVSSISIPMLFRQIQLKTLSDVKVNSRYNYLEGALFIGMIVSVILNLWLRTHSDAALGFVCHLFYFIVYNTSKGSLMVMLLLDKNATTQYIQKENYKEKLVKSAGLECEICEMDYNEMERTPRVLSECGHTICEECAEQHFGKLSVRCPFCRTVSSSWTAFSLPENKTVLERIKG